MNDEIWKQVQDVKSEKKDIVSSSSWQQNQNQSEGVVIIDAHRKNNDDSKHKYYVSQHLLQNSKWIASCSNFFMYELDIHLSDVDESIDHVLIHYLYIDAYQTLDNMKTSSTKKIIIEFKKTFSDLCYNKNLWARWSTAVSNAWDETSQHKNERVQRL